METDEGRAWPTMTMAEAAEVVGVSIDSVRRWIDEAEAGGRPVAERERDEQGRPVPGSWRRPYRDAVEAWKRRRQGQSAGEAAAG